MVKTRERGKDGKTAEKGDKKELEEKTQEKKQGDNQNGELQPEEPNKKQIIKAKKYKKKGYEQLKRITKSKLEKIFLLSATRSEDNWQFLVLAASGSQYHVEVSTVVHCTCMDFRFKKIPCKHIYFIVTQVGKNDELLDYFKSDRKISKNAYAILDKQLTQRLKSRIEQQPASKENNIDLKGETDCVICYSQMIKESQALEDCSTCKKYFHVDCIQVWKQHNPSCPLCRGMLTVDKVASDPLAKLTNIKI